MNSILILSINTIKALIRKKDFYVFFLLLIVLMIFLNLQNFYGIENISRFIKEAGLNAVWLFSFILATVFTAKQLPEEINGKTIYLLLSKPANQEHVILGRYLGSLISVFIAFSVFYLFYVLAVSLRGEGIPFILAMQGYILGFLFLALVCAIALFLSLTMTYASAVTFAFILFFSITIFGDFLRTITISSSGILRAALHLLYYILPHYEFYDISVRIVHNWQPLPAGIILALVLYTVIYSSLILNIACRIMRARIF